MRKYTNMEFYNSELYPFLYIHIHIFLKLINYNVKYSLCNIVAQVSSEMYFL